MGEARSAPVRGPHFPMSARISSSPSQDLVPQTADPHAPTVKFSRGSAEPSEDFDGRDALPVGTRLDEFEVLHVLGTGGFGIVYLALDHALMRQVAIKEYMPSALAVRGLGSWVALRAPQHAETFQAGLKSFVNEAQLLASFDHPSLLKVHRFWEDNGTAYMVMQYYPGRTLKQERLAMTEPPSEAWLRALVLPLLDALEVLHREGVYHRDISPDNILLQVDGPPVLLDFGAARKVIGDRTQTLTAILKPNFAPVEQYADIAGMRQGPWTDLYAVSAVLHYLLSGQPPTPAVARAVRDSLPLHQAAPGGVSVAFLRCVDWGLAVAPDDRPQKVAQMRDALSGRLTPPKPKRRHGDLAPRFGPRWRWGSAAVGLLATLTLAGWAYRHDSQPAVLAKPGTPATTVTTNVAAAKPAAAPAPKTTEAPSRPASTTRVTALRSPDEACAGRNFFSKALCVNRECSSDRFRQHPQCVKLRQENEASRQRDWQR